MIVTQLTKDLLPYFVFLIDGIADDLEWDIEIGKIFTAIREQESSCSWHSIQRAFHLREELKSEKGTGRKIHLTKKKTLDALTEFRYGKGYIFRDLVKNSRKINVPNRVVFDHYHQNEPYGDAISRVFDNNKEKECHIDGQVAILKEFKHELKSDIKYRDELIGQLEARISILEKTQFPLTKG